MYIKKINGLHNFYLNSLIKSKTLIGVTLLSILLPIATLIIMYFVNLNLLSSSYIYNIVLVVTCIIQLVVISIILFANPIIDNSELALIAKAIKRQKLFINKCIITSCVLVSIFSFKQL